MNANAFNALKQEQDEWANYLAEAHGGRPQNGAYAVVTQARAKYISMITKGYSAAVVTGDKVNVRSQPNTKGKVLFQVSRYIDGERERLIVDASNPARDNKGDIWYKVIYKTGVDEFEGESWYEASNGYINGRFIMLEHLTKLDYGMLVM